MSPREERILPSPDEDAEILRAWRDDVEERPMGDLCRRIVSRLETLPPDLHYTALECIGDIAPTSEALSDDELRKALEFFVTSPSQAAAARAAVLLLRDFHDRRYIALVENTLADNESPDFYSVLYALSRAAANGRHDAGKLLQQALRRHDVSEEAKTEISAAIETHRRETERHRSARPTAEK